MTAAGHDESGFTLIEMLVAIVAGIVVVFALSSVLIVTLHQTQRSLTQVNATRQARTALQTIDNELHSACVNGNVAPVQATSTSTTLKFLSFVGDQVNPTPQWHQLSFAGTTLTDTTYAVTGPTNGVYAQGAQLNSMQLLENVAAQTGTPVLQYFSYKPFLGTDGNYYWAIADGSSPNPVTGATLAAAPLSVGGTGLSSTDSGNTVEVVISLDVGAANDGQASNRVTGVSTPVSDSISMRLTSPPNNSTSGADYADYGPCQ